MKVTNIKWDIDMDQIYNKLDNMTAENAAEALSLPKDAYTNMTTSERHDYAYEVFHGHDDMTAEFMGLPTETDIPDDIGDDEDAISDYLSDEYEFCHKGFSLETDNKNNE